MTTDEARRIATAGTYGFRLWLDTPDGGELLDRAVWGSLPSYEVEELAADYGISHADAARTINQALSEGA